MPGRALLAQGARAREHANNFMVWMSEFQDLGTFRCAVYKLLRQDVAHRVSWIIVWAPWLVDISFGFSGSCDAQITWRHLSFRCLNLQVQPQPRCQHINPGVSTIAWSIKVEQNAFMYCKLMGGIFGLRYWKRAEREAAREHVKASAPGAI